MRPPFIFEEKTKRGFTLVEVMLAVFLLSVIAGLVIPNFGSVYKNFSLKKEARNLSFLMKYAQSRSIMKNNPQRIEFSEDLREYWLAEKSLGNQEDEFEKIEGRFAKTYRLPQAVTAETTQPVIIFYPNGQIDRARIYLCNVKKCYTISTQEQRGRVQIFEEKLD